MAAFACRPAGDGITTIGTPPPPRFTAGPATLRPDVDATALAPRRRAQTAADDAATLSGWGRTPVAGIELRSEDLVRLTEDAVLCRGLGRSYGDSSLPPPGTTEVAGTVLADRILGFDPASGMLHCEAGLALAELVRLFLPRGYFTPVSPGTKFVTVGGMVASDVHGKNHHRDGCFGEHVSWLRMRVADGSIVECSPSRHADLFLATIGGMGLTGHILEVKFRMVRVPSPWILEESERVPDIETFVLRLKESAARWPFTMGWIDCVSQGRHLGRGILRRGRWAEPDEAPKVLPAALGKLSVPITFPNWVLNRWTARAFNALYYRAHWQKRRWRLLHPDAFFYPLDAIHQWNRVYGRRGFTQYQCVVPDDTGFIARQFLELLTAHGGASPLCVIKDCGPEGRGLLSFPKPGISIAVDMAITRDTQHQIDILNEFVIAHGGRMYLTKDSFTRAEHYRAMEPRLEQWNAIRRKWDADGRIRSAQSVRILGDRP